MHTRTLQIVPELQTIYPNSTMGSYSRPECAVSRKILCFLAAGKQLIGISLPEYKWGVDRRSVVALQD